MISTAEEHRERARKLRELASEAPSRSGKARLNSRAEMFNAMARVVEQPAKPHGKKSAIALKGLSHVKSDYRS